MRLFTIIVLFTLYSGTANAQDIVYTPCDSIFIEDLIARVSEKEFHSSQERIIAIAESFIDREYVAGTLDKSTKETLYISTTEFDCTTFIETVLAVTMSVEKGERSFGEFCNNLETTRYRKGCRSGYDSRLHYFTWWVDDNTKKGLIREVTHCSISRKTDNSLYFMSKHPENYPALANDSVTRKKIEALEAPYAGSTIEYIPKEFLNKKQVDLPIANGDIIALVTDIEGLDVTHVGFALWIENRLHLLHASSAQGKIIKDEQTLFEYQKNKKRQQGIRAIRYNSKQQTPFSHSPAAL